MKQFLRTSLVPVAAALALALVAAPLLAAERPAGPPPGPKGPLAGYLRCLGVVGLTDVQKADVRALLEAAKPGLEALRATLKTDREALRAAVDRRDPRPLRGRDGVPEGRGRPEGDRRGARRSSATRSRRS